MRIKTFTYIRLIVVLLVLTVAVVYINQLCVEEYGMGCLYRSYAEVSGNK